jgi:predicted RNase H-like HicB family nuclease
MKIKSPKTTHLPILIEQDEDNMYIITCPTFKGCHAQGKSVEEALANIKEVISMCMDEVKPKHKSPLNRFIGFRELEVSFMKTA